MSEVRYITVPETIVVELQAPNGEAVAVPRPFAQLIKERTGDSRAFGTGREGSTAIDRLMLGVAIRQAFTGRKPGDVVGLPRDQWEALCDSLRNPEGAYFPEVMMQIITHVRAILDAPTTRPKSDVPAPELAVAPPVAAE